MHLTTQLTPSDLPKCLQEGISVAQAPSQADMLLLSLLTTAGYAMPQYYMRSGKPAHRYEPNLMTLVVAPPASGKGIMTLSRRLLQPLHDRMRKQTEEMLALAGSREEQEAVPQRMAFVPGNCSSNALLQILKDNDGRGCIVETEMDVLSQIWRHNYGDYSTLLRQAFEHETVSKARKTKTEAYLEVAHPCLSVLLSGTLGQLQPLLQSRENGLASRFLCYQASDIVPFDEETILKHDETADDDTTDRIFSRLAEQTTAMHDWLAEQEHDCEWQLRPEQAEALREHWGGNYEFLLADLQLPTTFDPVIKRLSVGLQRIGMILSMLRYFEESVWPQLNEGNRVALPEVLLCDDRDFRTLLTIADALTEHAIAVHQLLPANEAEYIVVQTAALPEIVMELLHKLPEQFTTKDAVEAGAPATDRTVRNYLRLLLEAEYISRIRHGKYEKAKKKE